MIDWLHILNTLSGERQDCVLITVAHTAGSAPREAGTKMVITLDKTYGTIGGGNLEHNAIQTARTFLSDKALTQKPAFLDLYALGPMLEQCCGGVVFLHYELINKDNSGWIKLVGELNKNSVNAVIVSRIARQDTQRNIRGKLIVTEFETNGSLGDLDQEATMRARELLTESDTSSATLLHPLVESKGALPDISDALLFDVIRPCDFHITLFGAGHVGSAIVGILQLSVPCRISWVDSRPDVFPAKLPGFVSAYHAIMPTNVVQEMPPNSFYLVMTHSHALDQALCEAVLKRGDFRFLGLIGSETKRLRFGKRLREKGIDEKQLERLSCPIGINDINSKEPGAIAVSVVAQLLQLYEVNRDSRSGLNENNNVYSI